MRFRRHLYLLTFLVAVAIVGVVGVDTVVASGTTDPSLGLDTFGDATQFGQQDIRVTIARIINVALTLLGVVAVGLMLYAGFLWMTAGGQEDRIATARKILINATIGLAIILTSFAITRFVLQRLIEATGFEQNTDILCQDPEYRVAHPEVCGSLTCDDPVFAANNPLMCDPENPPLCEQFPALCLADSFYVSSITPRTDNTRANNMVIRVLLSSPLQTEPVAGAPATEIVTITHEGDDVTDQFVVNIFGEGGTYAITRADGETILAPGTYTVTVRNDLVSEDGKTVEAIPASDPAGAFPLSTTFTITTDGVVDDRPMVMQEMLIDNEELRGYDDDEVKLVSAGKLVPVDLRVHDVSGAGYVELLYEDREQTSLDPVQQAGGTSAWYQGPRITRGSDATPSNLYIARYPFFFDEDGVYPRLIALSGYGRDLDSNPVLQTPTRHIVVVGAHCDAAGEPVSPEFAEECLKKTCTADWQCSTRACDESTGQCVAYPIITSVDPWSGGTGDFITINGHNFGSTQGVSVVELGIDNNANDAIDDDEWFVASPPAACGSFDLWNDTYVVIELPDDTVFPVDAKAAVRITTDPTDPNFQDTTLNSLGGVIGQAGFEGYITKVNTQRPRLCSVVTDPEDVATSPVPPNATAAPAGTRVRADGELFGTAQGVFLFGTDQGGVSTPVSAWSDLSVQSVVPSNYTPGKTVVRIEDTRGVKSNGVPFTVLGADILTRPQITAMTPSTPRRREFFTIQGQRFGSLQGQVWMAPTQEQAVGCALPATRDDAVCTLLDATIFSQCTDTWSDTEVIGYIPSTVDVGTYAVVLVTATGERTDGTDQVTVTEGDPGPSICSLAPTSGPAPLPVGDPGTPASERRVLLIGGLNFGTNPTAFFWKRTALEAQTVTDLAASWLSLSAGALADATQSRPTDIFTSSDESIRTTIPIQDGESMSSGPIVVATADGLISNPVTYTVLDCREHPDSAPGDGFQCCTIGGDAGLWKEDTVACEGEERSAGYVWRFASGVIPERAYVLEQCKTDVPVGEPVPMPSPTPLSSRDGDAICLNAVVSFRLAFAGTMPVVDAADPGSLLYPGNVQLYKVTPTASGDVGSLTPVPGASPSWFWGVTTIWNGEQDLEPNTWYRVIISDAVETLATTQVGGQTVQERRAIERSAPCGDGTAYCYDFTTGGSDNRCIVRDAGVAPDIWTTQELGLIRDVLGQIVHFTVFGRTDNACLVLNVDKYPWQWAGVEPNVVSAVKDGGDGIINARARATAVAETDADGSEIEATVTITQRIGAEDVTTPLRGVADVVVALGDPEVEDWWVDCQSACINSGLGARFTRTMDQSTYADGFRIFRCTDGELCEPDARQLVPLSVISVDTALSDDRTMIMNLNGDNTFDPNTWYVVQLTDNIRAIGGFDEDGGVLPGDTLAPFEWKFQTKNDPTPCIATQVSVEPLWYLETAVGNKKSYRAQPFGAPDECSPAGQQLNPWSFDWSWSEEDNQVVSISNFQVAGDPAPWCTASCVPYGSTVGRAVDGSAVAFPLCGNGVVDAGEDCDVAIAGETAAHEIGNAGELGYASCTYRCERPGNEIRGAIGQIGVCGNGVYEPAYGEECDPGDRSGDAQFAQGQGSASLCTDACRLTGTVSVSQTGGSAAGAVCGGGTVGPGEECDPGSETDPYCSTQCLNTGTDISQAYCDSVDRTQLSLEQRAALATACAQGAISVCGNGIIEQGETCEIGSTATPDATADTCSAYCLAVGDVCDTSLAQCEAGTPGCSAGCLLKGTSLEYPTPSFCGDGIDGAGEYPGCDIGGLPTVIGQPAQIATAVGEGTVDDAALQTMESQIAATLRGTVLDRVVTPSPGVRGQGTYVLQCGFEEFATPTVVQQGTDLITIYNNCYEAGQGVGDNSCCYPRPVRTDSYPADGAGITGAPVGGVCRNSLITATFDQAIDETSLENNIRIATYHDESSFACETVGGVDVTDEAIPELAYVEVPAPATGFFGRVWSQLRSTVQRWFGPSATAADVPYTLCAGGLNADVQVQTVPTDTGAASTVTISIRELLAANQTYAVLFRGGADGVKSVNGVGIGTVDVQEVGDAWLFRTSGDVCRIASVEVTPSSVLYTEPFATRDLRATAKTGTGGQLITPIPEVYDWAWNWIPQTNPLFDIPVEGTPSAGADISIGARNLEGTLTAFAQATITADTLSGSASQLDDTIAGPVTLTAAFCDNIWPASGRQADGSWLPFQDDQYNFEFYYCADAGTPGSRVDDLPFFTIYEANRATAPTLPQETLRRYLLVDSTLDLTPEQAVAAGSSVDVIGVQILQNPNRVSLDEWYQDRFANFSQMQRIQLDGYAALTNGDNYYVGALNLDDASNALYNNVYLFTVNRGAQEPTRAVLQQLLETLRFNTNIPDDELCLAATDDGSRVLSDTACVSDGECRVGDPPEGSTWIASGLPQDGLTGVCGNDRTKLLRDLERIDDIQRIQSAVNQFVGGQQTVGPRLEGGTFYPSYTNSRWASWQATLGSDLRQALPVDPINEWSVCGGEGTDPQTCWNPDQLTYACPQYQSIYEYVANPVTGVYNVYASLEFLTPQRNVLTSPGGQSFVDAFVDETTFINGRWCAADPVAGTVLSPFGAQCGDGVLQKNAVRQDGSVYSEFCEIGQTYEVPCGNGGTQTYVCNATCSAFDLAGEPGVCVGAPVCGNGIVEGAEQCDSGALNGTYGNCNATCSGSFLAQCGNGAIDYIDNNGNGRIDAGETFEFCEQTGICRYALENGTIVKQQVHVMLSRDTSMTTCAGGSCVTPTDPWNRARSIIAALDARQEELDTNRLTISAFPGNWEAVGGGTSPDRSATTPECAVLNTANLPVTPSSPLDLPAGYGQSTIAVSGSPVYSALQQVITNLSSVFTLTETSERSIILVLNNAPTAEITAPSVNGTTATYRCRPDIVNDVQAADETVRLLEELHQVYGVDVYVVVPDDTVSNSDRAVLSRMAVAGGVPSEAAYNTIGVYYYETVDAAVSDILVNDLLQCEPYGRTPGGTCAVDCQSFGPYCGDGFLDTLYGEQCDDGNRQSGDGCSAICQQEVGAVAPPGAGPGICGNGVIDAGEVCDEGGRNGVAPDPGTIPYSESRTYCSNTCQDILTVDAAAYCGNGVRDFVDVNSDGLFTAGDDTYLEVCDVRSDGQVTTDATGVPLAACADKGEHRCINSCQQLESTCVSCGLVDVTSVPTTLSVAAPLLSLINPIAIDQTFVGWLGNPTVQTGVELVDTVGPVRTSVPIVTDIDTFAGQPHDAIKIAERISSRFTDGTALPQSWTPVVITENACVDEYQLRFNASVLGVGASLESSPLLDQFPYPVDGEIGIVEHTLITSPAVPEFVTRIVVKWVPDEVGTSVVFPINAYAVGLVGGVLSPHQNVFTAMTRDVICDEMVFGDGRYEYYASEHWMCASQTAAGDSTETFLSPQGNTLTVGLDIHESRIVSDVGVSSMTLYDLTNFEGQQTDADPDPVAFYVNALTSGSERPIYDFRNSSLQVEVYEYHAGQDNRYSVYRPTRIFRIKDAANTSSNAVARYWHVFNMEWDPERRIMSIQPPVDPATRRVLPHGSIETKSCGIIENIPGQPRCPSP